jgi:hypothetical protein
MPVNLKFRGEETLLLSVTSSVSFGVEVFGTEEPVIACSFWAASNREQRSIAATKSKTVPPAPQAKR